MTNDELINVFKYIVKKCDMIINSDYEADDFVLDNVEDIAELCNLILDGNYGELIEDKVNKTLHLKRERVDKSKYKFPQGLAYDLTGWTENDIHLLNECLTAFKEHSNGEFDFYIGEYGLIGGDPLDSDAPDGFYPVVDQARKEYGETLKNK